MNGHELRYQNGFDCQGLWVEVEVEKELKLKSKRDIENLVPGDPFASIDRFVQDCKDRVDKYANIQTEQSIRLGYWMDWDRDEDWAKPPDERRSYFTMSEENNYTIWSFLKKCHDRGLIYRGYDAMPWCPRCSVGLSQMEMARGLPAGGPPGRVRAFPAARPARRKPPRLDDDALDAQQQRRRRRQSGADLPQSAAQGPGLLPRQRRLHGAAAGRGVQDARRWVEGVPKLKTLEQIFKEKGGYEIVGELKGAEMVGWAYDGPFDELPAAVPSARLSARNRRGRAWRQAELGAGASRRRQRPPRHRLEGRSARRRAPASSTSPPAAARRTSSSARRKGCRRSRRSTNSDASSPVSANLTGKSAVDHATTDWILANLKQKGVLLEVEQYPHSYPHCWRCKTELLFRLVDEWFINMSWRDEIMAVVEQGRWLPESINGKARELDWLTNMGDWMISKKRFWGLALPIWVDEVTGDFEVIGSREELKERAVEGWRPFEGHTPHRPWVDQVKIRNPKTGNLMSRIPDVGNPWLDAGIVPFSTMKYNTDREYWKKWFPADFITEASPASSATGSTPCWR